MGTLTQVREAARLSRLRIFRKGPGIYKLCTLVGDTVVEGSLVTLEQHIRGEAPPNTQDSYFTSPEWFVLRERGAAVYLEYIESFAWKSLRQEALQRDKTCRTCDSSNRLQVHHRKYPRRWRDDSVNNLIVLCYDCHKAIHAPRLGRGAGHLQE